MEFKTNLKNFRIAAGLSQEELADQCGVSHQTISRWETGRTYPATEHFFKLCNIFDCNLAELLGETDATANRHPIPGVRNKTWFIAELSQRTGYSKFECQKINHVLESHFLLGRQNKAKVLKDLAALGYDKQAADEIYNLSSKLLLEAIHYKLRHPFSVNQEDD